MTWKRKKCGGIPMKDCEKGFTLIELVIVIGIIAVFSGVIFQVIATTSTMMRNTSATTKRQMEIQEIENKLENLLLQTNKKIYYAYGNADGILGEIEEGETKKEKKSLYLISQDEENSVREETLDVITWNQKEKTLIYEQVKLSNNQVMKRVQETLAFNVIQFQIDLSDIEDHLVYFHVKIEKSGKQSEAKKSIYLRNSVVKESPF